MYLYTRRNQQPACAGRLTRRTHYHSSIWGTFVPSDQWLSIPRNGQRPDISHESLTESGSDLLARCSVSLSLCEFTDISAAMRPKLRVPRRVITTVAHCTGRNGGRANPLTSGSRCRNSRATWDLGAVAFGSRGHYAWRGFYAPSDKLIHWTVSFCVTHAIHLTNCTVNSLKLRLDCYSMLIDLFLMDGNKLILLFKYNNSNNNNYYYSRVEAVAVCLNVWLDGLRHTTAHQ